MLRIATVEDDANDLEALRTHLSRYEKENGLKFQVTEFRDGEDIVTDYSADYDLILMDIEMAFLNGMKAAEKIRELDKDVIIIFITNMPQYAIQGYKVNALDYMLKPISYFSFSESMGRALHRVNVQEKEFITIALKAAKRNWILHRSVMWRCRTTFCFIIQQKGALRPKEQSGMRKVSWMQKAFSDVTDAIW